MRFDRSQLLLALLASLVWSFHAPRASAVDIESFEFNDATGTVLQNAVNTAHGGNAWVPGTDLTPSQVGQNIDGRPGSYYIFKNDTGSSNNFLQIDDITTGKRYLTTKIAGWDFQGENNEQFRLAFINGDTAPNFSNLITAQVSLVRGSDGMVELTGGALGAGASAIVSDVKFPAVHNSAFEMTLEFDRTANKYKVFYRDGTGPTQVLGTAYTDPTRDGKALRMQITGKYNEFLGNFPGSYMTDFFSFFAVDRIALTDTNPHADLITLEVDRTNGAMTLRNTSGAAINGIESYSITSTAGALNPANWTPIGGGTNTSSNTELAQTFAGGINLTNNQTIPLSNASGAWLKSPFEDLSMVLNLAGGVTRTVNVSFINNLGERWAAGDLNFDRSINAADYALLAANAEMNLASLSLAEAYRKGDLDGNKTNSIEDFSVFKNLYEAQPGAGSFEALVASVPEPGTMVLLAIAVGFTGLGRRRRPASIPNYVRSLMLRKASYVGLILIVASAMFSTSVGYAAILEDFMFNEPNGTPLGDTANSVNPSNLWLVHANTVDSSTFNGSFRINKQSVATQAANALEIDNITNKKAWLVAEIAGWNYTATAAGERVRFAFLDNDPASTGGSTITAEANIDRTASGGLELNGSALGTGATLPASALPLTLSRTTPFSIALELDKINDRYTVYYKDNNNPFQELGFGSLGNSAVPGGKRAGNSIRFAFTGTFGDVGEYFDVNRIYLTDTSPLGGVVTPSALSLEVRSDGKVYIKNKTSNAISFDSYRIASGSNSLSFGGWKSLESQLVDFGSANAGDHWTAAGGSSDGALAESYLLDFSTINPGGELFLGNAFKVGGAQDLTFQYRDAVTGALPSVVPDYVTVVGLAGDYNGNGTVDAADYTIWRDTLGSTTDLRANGDNTGASQNKIDQADYQVWKANFGASGSGANSIGTVPEPTGLFLFLVGAAAITSRRSAVGSQRIPS